MKVAKWGNSLALRLPAVVVEALKLKPGDEIEIHVVDNRRFGVAPKPARDRLLNVFAPSAAVSLPTSSLIGMTQMPASFFDRNVLSRQRLVNPFRANR